MSGMYPELRSLEKTNGRVLFSERQIAFITTPLNTDNANAV